MDLRDAGTDAQLPEVSEWQRKAVGGEAVPRQRDPPVMIATF
jgi:hypothetical protein